MIFDLKARLRHSCSTAATVATNDNYSIMVNAKMWCDGKVKRSHQVSQLSR